MTSSRRRLVPAVLLVLFVSVSAYASPKRGEETPALSDKLQAFEPLLGTWDGLASGAGREVRSVWEWTSVARGDALLMTVKESFDGGPLDSNMVEFATVSDAPNTLSTLTANGRGGFVMQGRMAAENGVFSREWSLTSGDAPAIRGRDRLELTGADRIVWTQHFNQGDGWTEAPYSPFSLQRRPVDTNAADEPTYAAAVSDDMTVFEPYIGTWLGEIFQSAADEPIRFAITYDWFDRNQSIVKLVIEQRWVESGRSVVTQEGFYGLHPTEARINYLGVGIGGRTAVGGLVEFEPDTHRRVTYMQARGQDGDIVQVRDEFSIVSPDSWRSVTSIRQSEEWGVVSDSVYTRSESGAGQ